MVKTRIIAFDGVKTETYHYIAIEAVNTLSMYHFGEFVDLPEGWLIT